MKKILGVSIAALLAVTPMLASAAGTDPDPATTSSDPYLGVAVNNDDKGHIASTAYVKGAYNAAIGAVNAVSAAKQNKIMNDATGAAQAQITGATITVAASGGSDTLVPTEKAVRTAIGDAITAAGGQTEDQVKALIGAAAAGASDGLTGDTTNGTLAVNADGSTIEIFAEGTNAGKVGIKAGGVDTTQLADGAVETAKIENLAVTDAKLAANSVTNGKIADGAVSATKLESGLVQISVRSSVDSNAEGYAAWNGNNTVASEKAVATAITNRLMNGSDSNTAVAMESVVQQTVRDAATLEQNTGNTLASEKAVRSAIDTATTGMATQTGVVATIGSSYVPIYTDWAHQSYYNNVLVQAANYTTTPAQSAPAGVQSGE